MSKSCKKTIGWVASLLALILVIGIALSLENASASNIIPSYTVKLSKKIEKIEVTLTNTEDEEDTKTVKTNSEGEAVFEDFLEVGKKYNLTTSHITGYEKIKEVIEPEQTDKLKEIELTELEKITVSGKITKHDGKTSYEGATISFLSEDEKYKFYKVTKADGTYKVTLYQDKDKKISYKIFIEPREEDGGHKKVEINESRTYSQNKSDENFSLLGVFEIKLPSPLEHGSVTVDKDKVTQGEDYKITVTPDSDYYLGEIKINNVKVSWNSIKMGENGTYSCEIKNVQEEKKEQKIDVTLLPKIQLNETTILSSIVTIKAESGKGEEELVSKADTNDGLIYIYNKKTKSIKIYPTDSSATGIGYKTISDNQ